MGAFTINYDTKKLSLHYNGEYFNWSLDDGDIGDFWHSFTTKSGDVFDINFHQESEKQTPSLAVYDTYDKGGVILIDTSRYELMHSYITYGDMNNYFKH